MNIDAFRRLLGDLAAEAPANAPGHQRLAGIDAKVARARRTRAVVGVGGVAAVVVIAAVVRTHVARDADPTPPVTTDSRHTVPIDLTPTKLPTVTDHGTVFYKDAAGMRLIGHEVADPGRRWLTLTSRRTREISHSHSNAGGSATSGVWRHAILNLCQRHSDGGGGRYCFQPPRGPLEGLDSTTATRRRRIVKCGRDSASSPASDNHQNARARPRRSGRSVSTRLRPLHGRRPQPSGGHRGNTEEIRDSSEYRTLPALTKAFSGRHWVLQPTSPSVAQPVFVWTGAVDMHARGTLRLLPGDHGWRRRPQSGGRSSGTFHSGHGPVRVTFRGAPSSTGRLWLAVYRQTR